MADVVESGRGRFYQFKGAFRIADKKLPPASPSNSWDEALGILHHTSPSPHLWNSDLDFTSYHTPPGPNLWSFELDGTQLSTQPNVWSEWSLVLEWVSCIGDLVRTQHGLQLEGQVGYQGEETMDNGLLCMRPDGNLLKLTIKNCPGVMGAVTRDDVAALEQLSHDQLQESDAFGRSAIMLAAMYRSWNSLIHLLQQPSSIKWSQMEAQKGMSALHFIAENPHRDILGDQYTRVMSLLPSNLSLSIVNASDYSGRVPLDHAVACRNEAAFKWLLKHGADPNGLSDQGYTENWELRSPLQTALAGHHVYYTRQLLESGSRLWLTRNAMPYGAYLQSLQHLPVLVQYGVPLHYLYCGPAMLHYNRGYNILDNLHWPANTTLSQQVRAAVNEGLAPRRHLVVKILAIRLQPLLTRDVLQLICCFADLLPYKYEAPELV